MCFQFPAVVNIDVDVQSTSLENPAQNRVKRHAVESLNSKNSLTSVNRVNSLQSNNHSSDTDVYTDTDDDDDDIMIVQEERRSLFSALKSRMNDKEPGKSCSNQSKPPKAIAVKETSDHLGGESKKRKGTKNKRTSAIVYLSFSDDESKEECQFNQNSLQSYATKTQTTNQDNCVLVETQKQQINKADPPHGNKNVRKECSEKLDRKLVESSPSNHDTDSCEDSDDLPCVLPSSLYSDSEGSSHSCKSLPSSCTNNYKSSDSRAQGSNIDSQDCSEIPLKRTKRSAEEITQQRNEALVSITFIIMLISYRFCQASELNTKRNSSH